MQIKNELETLQFAETRLQQLIDSHSQLQPGDADWLNELGRALGTTRLPVRIPLSKQNSLLELNVLSWEDLSTHPEAQTQVLTMLRDSLRALSAAASYRPGTSQFDSVSVPCHNHQIADKLSSVYSSQKFNQLLEFCLEKGVFAQKISSTGLVQTADAEENWEMSGRQWVTDTVRCGSTQRHFHPTSWPKALLSLANFYNQTEELDAIQASIADPDYYRSGGLINGVAHIFLPASLQRDRSWFNNKRLESHGLALKAFCDTIVDGLVQHQKYGFTEAFLQDTQQKNVLASAIINLASYLKAINTNPSQLIKQSPSGQPTNSTLAVEAVLHNIDAIDFAAPSAGPWEEIPFAGGLTWDTEAIRAGFESLRNLLFESSYLPNKALEDFRTLLHSHPYAGWLADEPVLQAAISKARAKVLERLFGNREPCEHPHRPCDSSLAFITTSTICLGETLAEDVLNNFKILEFLEKKLVRENGIIRYSSFDLPLAEGGYAVAYDGYLADNYWIFPSLRALLTRQKTSIDKGMDSSDYSSEGDYLDRMRMARPDTEAEWCWLSVIAQGYAKQSEKLLQKWESAGSLSQEEYLLLKKGQSKATEYINRSYARITGTIDDTISYKANGKECPAFAIPEAYEWVTSIVEPGAKVVLPGANTPLSWAQASLFEASQLFASNLQKLELLGEIKKSS